MDGLEFPSDFAWGVAASAYQIEGAVDEDGRGLSMWDTFSHAPGNTNRGETGDVACDHYHRYPEDVALMADLGVTTYRFSVAWPRIQADGSGAPNQKGLDFYSRLVDTLLEHGIAPCPTLYHWDLPQPLSDAGGWWSRDTAERFAEYGELMARALGDRAPMWITHNEPAVSAYFGYALGRYAPGEARGLDIFPVIHHLLVSHGLAVQAMRPHLRPDAQTGIAHNLAMGRPFVDKPADVQAADFLTALQVHVFCDPAFSGSYPEIVLQHAPAGDAIRDGDLALVGHGHDFLGVNYYGPQYAEAGKADSPFPIALEDNGQGRVPDGMPVNDMGVPVDPGGLTDLLRHLRDRYGQALPPLYLTENGTACPDVPGADGSVDDPERIAYLADHLRVVRSAIEDGCDIRGYFVWSLLDNFEWAYGYSKRFGLVYVDYPTQQRIPKSSYRWYRDLIAKQRRQSS
jgi:beta-glucosidase